MKERIQQAQEILEDFVDLHDAVQGLWFYRFVPQRVKDRLFIIRNKLSTLLTFVEHLENRQNQLEVEVRDLTEALNNQSNEESPIAFVPDFVALEMVSNDLIEWIQNEKDRYGQRMETDDGGSEFA